MYVFICIFAYFMFALVGIFIRDLIINFGLYSTLTIRLFIGGLLLILISYKELKNINKSNVLNIFTLVLFSFGLQFLSWGTVKHVNTSDYAFLTSTSIIALPVLIKLGLVENKLKRKSDKLALGSVIIGMMIITFPKGGLSVFNIYYAILISYVFLGAVYLVYLQRITKTNIGKVYQGICFTTNGILFLILNNGKVNLKFDNITLLKVVVVILFGTVLYQYLGILYMRNLSYSTIQIIALTSPLLSSFWGFVLLKDIPSIRTIIGGIIILIALFVHTKKRKINYHLELNN